MPRDGAVILSDVRTLSLTILCEACGRRERYTVERLMSARGANAKVPDLLATLAVDCPKAQWTSIYDRCRARYERYGGA